MAAPLGIGKIITGALIGYAVKSYMDAQRSQNAADEVCFRVASPSQLPQGTPTLIVGQVEGVIQAGGRALLRRVNDAYQILLQDAQGQVADVIGLDPEDLFGQQTLPADVASPLPPMAGTMFNVRYRNR